MMLPSYYQSLGTMATCLSLSLSLFLSLSRAQYGGVCHLTRGDKYLHG